MDATRCNAALLPYTTMNQILPDASRLPPEISVSEAHGAAAEM